MIIAIDGPSGAGKSTLGKLTAKEFGLIYLDTGAMYRCVGLAVLKSDIDIEDRSALKDLLEGIRIEFDNSEGLQRVLLDGRDVSKQIRTPEVTSMASVVSTIGIVRETLVAMQQEIGRSANTGAVLDGRDIGSVVFPDADFKFFLTADAENRARRRYLEDKEKGVETTFEKTLSEIRERDERDANRAHSPLIKAKDAIEIDTSEIDVDQVFAVIRKAIEG